MTRVVFADTEKPDRDGKENSQLDDHEAQRKPHETRRGRETAVVPAKTTAGRGPRTAQRFRPMILLSRQAESDGEIDRTRGISENSASVIDIGGVEPRRAGSASDVPPTTRRARLSRQGSVRGRLRRRTTAAHRAR
jgi:hypothetical protein